MLAVSIRQIHARKLNLEGVAMQFNAKFVETYMDNFGSDRREIFIAFAQSGSANSPHSQLDIVPLIPKKL
jgi:hypothetical protein